MSRGIHISLVSCMLICFCCLCTGLVSGFGEYSGQIESPLTPFGLTYIPESNYLVVCQYIDGQAGRFKITGPGEVESFESMFSPISDGHANGIAWCELDGALYWLVEKQSTEGSTYTLLRSKTDGWALEPGPEVEVPAGTILGDITYFPDLDAFVTVNISTDQYLFISRETGEILENTFYSPTQHPDSKVSYGLGLDYVPQGYFDLLVGKITDLRAMRVVRVDSTGAPTGLTYDIDINNEEIRPGWPTGIAYCKGTTSTFTVIGDAFRDKLLVFNTPELTVPSIANVDVTLETKDIGPGQDTESIAVNFSWQNEPAIYDNVKLLLYNTTTGNYDLVDSSSEGAISHEIGKEGIFSYALTPIAGGIEAPATEIEVKTGGGDILRKANLKLENSTSYPFAVTLVEKAETTVYVAELKPLEETTQTIVHRLKTNQTTGALEEIQPIFSPCPDNCKTIGLTWDPINDELMWLGYREQSKTYVIARTNLEGDIISGPKDLVGIPYPQDTLGDIACDSAGNFWIPALEHKALFSFDRDGNCTGDKILIPGIPSNRGQEWGLTSGVSIIPGLQEGTNIFFTTTGIIPTNIHAPSLGTGYVTKIIPFIRDGENGSRMIGTPIDIAFSTGSALIRGIAIKDSQPQSVFVVAGDIGYIYELTLSREGPKFSRGDVNTDNAVNLADAVFTLQYLFQGGTAPSCLDTADINDSGEINISDALCILRYVFKISGEDCVSFPFGMCGTDPNTDALSCESYDICN